MSGEPAPRSLDKALSDHLASRTEQNRQAWRDLHSLNLAHSTRLLR